MKKSFRPRRSPSLRPAGSKPAGMNPRPTRSSTPFGGSKKSASIFRSGGSVNRSPGETFGQAQQQPYGQTSLPRRRYRFSLPLIIGLAVIACCFIVMCIGILYLLSQGQIQIPTFQ